MTLNDPRQQKPIEVEMAERDLFGFAVGLMRQCVVENEIAEQSSVDAVARRS